MDLEDHLSIGLLGATLFNLSLNSPVRRSKLPGLHHGRPNLLICGEDEIFPAVISIYMKDAKQPLPNRSEVLVCSAQTTKDDVERFVRRALCTCQTKGKPPKAIYTAVIYPKIIPKVSLDCIFYCKMGMLSHIPTSLSQCSSFVSLHDLYNPSTLFFQGGFFTPWHLQTSWTIQILWRLLKCTTSASNPLILTETFS